MKVLAVGREAPWLGPRSGNSIRRDVLVRGAARAGPVDYMMLSSSPAPDTEPPWYVRTVVRVPTEQRRTGAAGHAEWRLASAFRRDAPPYELSRFRLVDSDAARSVLAPRFADHDVLWLLDKHAAFLLTPFLDAASIPVILDVDELVAQRYWQEATLLRERAPKRLIDRATTWARRADRDRNAHAWDRWTRRLAGLARVSTVANPADVAALAPAAAVALPNGCRVPPSRGAAPMRTDRPVFVFHGLMSYPPNADGATYLVDELLPEMERALRRDFEVRIVGDATDALRALGARHPRVTVTGYVEDVVAEVRSADVVVVPLRVGSGTRLKILEAMAIGTPVVSTTVGCDGLAVTDGEHLLVADEPAAFAAACARVVDDAALRSGLVERAYQLVATRYDWRLIEAEVEALTRAQVATR